MTFLELIQPHFGLVRILEYALDDDIEGGLLLRYDEKANWQKYLYDMNIVEDGLSVHVRLLFDDGKFQNAKLNVKSDNLQPFIDYLHSLISYMTDQGYYEVYKSDVGEYCTFSNFLNELTINFFDNSVYIELGEPNSESPHDDPAFEQGGFKTYRLMEANKRDEWCQIYKQSLVAKEKVKTQNLEISSVWENYIGAYKKEKPRLYACLQKAAVATENGEGMSIMIPVSIKAQADWIEKNILPEMKRELAALIGGKEVKVEIQCAKE